MDEATRNRLKQDLLELQLRLRREIKERVEALPEDILPPGDDWREPSGSLDDELAVESVQENLYERVSNALFRMDEGTYGCCLGCNRDIDEERLASLPYAEYCIQCERRHESA